MSTRMRDSLMSELGGLRHEPTAKRIRAVLARATVVDSTRAVLLWEPRRIVPSYAVPEEDLRADLLPAPTVTTGDDEVGVSLPDLSSRPVLDPGIPFAVHTADGEALDMRIGGHHRPGAAFRPADPDLPGYVVLDFAAFDAWFEEEEPNVAHPRDPFHRIDVLAGSRHLRVELDGRVLAESSRPTLLFETMLPPRFYLPREDVVADLVPSATRSFCAYKGEASYWSVELDDGPVADVAWTYERPLHEAEHVRDLVAFFDERVDVVLDGERRERPVTPWSVQK
jgi:Uncharacterized protein conserved in bacteria